MTKYLAERVGTFILVLFGCGTAVVAGDKVGIVGIALAFPVFGALIDAVGWPLAFAVTGGVTALLATHRLQDGFALANFHFDSQSKKVRRDSSPESARVAPTRFLVLRAGKIYFEGSPDELMKSPDPYLQRFLI